MPEQNNDPEPADPPEGGNDPSAEDAFWTKMGSFLDERLDAAIDRGVKKHVPKSRPGTSRTGGRLTLPQVIADALGGPFTSETTRQKQGK